MLTTLQKSIGDAFRQPLDYSSFASADILDYFFQSALVPLVKSLIETPGKEAGGVGVKALTETLGSPALARLVEDTAARMRATYIADAPVDEGSIAAELYKELPDGLEGTSEEAASIRTGLARILQAVDAVDLALRAAKPEARASLRDRIALLAAHLPDLAWMEARALAFREEDAPSESGADLDALALMHISPAEMMRSRPVNLSPAQQDLIIAIQEWHKSEMALSEKRVTRLRWLARALVIGLIALFVVILGVGLYSIRTTLVARSNASLAETNAVMAGDIARIAATDVVAASTAKVASTQSLATAQVAATTVVQLNADQLAAQALSQIEERQDLALLLSLEAFRNLDSVKTRGALLTSLNEKPAIERYLGGRSGAVLSVAYSPDGASLATGGTDETILLYREISGKMEIVPLNGHNDAVYALAFSPDGTRLASGSKDGKILLWDLASGKPEQEGYNGHAGAVYALAFNNDGSLLVSGGEDKTVRLWDADNGQPLGEPRMSHKGSVTTLCFAPDGKTFVSAGLDANIYAWDARTGAAVNKIVIKGLGPVWSASFSPDGRFLAVGGNDQAVHIWDFKRGSVFPKPLLGHQGAVLTTAFTPDGSLLVSGGDDGIYLWSLKTDASGNSVFEPNGQSVGGHRGPVKSLAVSPDGRFLASASSSEQTTLVWSLPALLQQGITGGEVLRGHNEPVSSLAFSPDGGMLASGSWDKNILIWDLARPDAPAATLSGHTGYVMGLAFSPDGKRLASAGVDNSVRVWDMQTLQPAAPPLNGHTNWVRSVAFSPDGRFLASSSWDQSVRLWDAASLQPAGSPIGGFTGPVYALGFSPAGDVLFTGSDSARASLAAWGIKDFPSAAAAPGLTYGSESTIYSLALDETGKLLAAGGTGRTIRIWDVQSGAEARQPLVGHSGDILSLAFQPGGSMLASASSDTSIRLWELDSGTTMGTLNGHKDFVYALAFHPQGKMLASGGADNLIFLWDTDSESWAGRACRKAGRNLTQGEWTKYLGAIPYQKTCPENP